MGSKAAIFFKDQIDLIITWIVIFKFIIIGLSPADCYGALILLLSIQASKVIGYLFPKRPDLFRDINLLHEQIQELIIKNEEIERDVTGLKFFAANRK